MTRDGRQQSNSRRSASTNNRRDQSQASSRARSQSVARPQTGDFYTFEEVEYHPDRVPVLAADRWKPAVIPLDGNRNEIHTMEMVMSQQSSRQAALTTPVSFARAWSSHPNAYRPPQCENLEKLLHHLSSQPEAEELMDELNGAVIPTS
jgi:hypothetical protein